MSFTSVLKGFLGVALLGVAAQGCIVVGGGSGSLPAYSRGCVSSTDCAGATVFCRQANTITATGGGGYFCTASCSTSGACPASPNGAPLVCVTAGGSSQCYEGCTASRTCLSGYAAAMDPAGTCFCIPN